MAATDPTFYRSPGAAIAAAPEQLAYVVAFDPAGQAKDALAVVDCDLTSSSYGRVVGWSELPTAGNELHHFGWNACSSALCHEGHDGHSMERRYLVIPGIRSSNTYVLDTKTDPRNPVLAHTIAAVNPGSLSLVTIVQLRPIWWQVTGCSALVAFPLMLTRAS